MSHPVPDLPETGPSPARVRLYRLSCQWLTHLTSGSGLVKVLRHGTPYDARVVGCTYDPYRHVLNVVVWSELFDEVPEGRPVPEAADPLFRQYDARPLLEAVDALADQARAAGLEALNPAVDRIRQIVDSILASDLG